MKRYLLRFDRESEYDSFVSGDSYCLPNVSTIEEDDSVRMSNMKWNQLLQNGDFSNGTTSWSVIDSNMTISVSSGVLTVTKLSGGMGGIAKQVIPGLNTTHKYYMAATLKTNTSGQPVVLGFHTNGGTVGSNTNFTTSNTSFTRVNGIASPKNATDILCIRTGSSASANNTNASAKNVILVDLTELYGKGNEPTNVNEFLSTYQRDYYPYKPL